MKYREYLPAEVQPGQRQVQLLLFNGFQLHFDFVFLFRDHLQLLIDPGQLKIYFLLLIFEGVFLYLYLLLLSCYTFFCE